MNYYKTTMAVQVDKIRWTQNQSPLSSTNCSSRPSPNRRPPKNSWTRVTRAMAGRLRARISMSRIRVWGFSSRVMSCRCRNSSARKKHSMLFCPSHLLHSLVAMTIKFAKTIKESSEVYSWQSWIENRSPRPHHKLLRNQTEDSQLKYSLWMTSRIMSSVSNSWLTK